MTTKETKRLALHLLAGIEAERDEALVRELARELKTSYISGNLPMLEAHVKAQTSFIITDEQAERERVKAAERAARFSAKQALDLSKDNTNRQELQSTVYALD